MARRKQPVIPDALLDLLLAGADAKSAFDKDGLRDELKKARAERALDAALDHHLDVGKSAGNRRNGYGKCRLPEGGAYRAIGTRSVKIISMYARFDDDPRDPGSPA